MPALTIPEFVNNNIPAELWRGFAVASGAGKGPWAWCKARFAFSSGARARFAGRSSRSNPYTQVARLAQCWHDGYTAMHSYLYTGGEICCEECGTTLTSPRTHD